MPLPYWLALAVVIDGVRQYLADRKKAMKVSKQLRKEKIALLVEQWGYDDVDELIEAVHIDSVVPAICMNPDCDYSTEYEPDCTAGWCECCNEGSCVSILILVGII